jgi:hypothetical protein
MEKRKQTSAEKTRIHKGLIGTSNAAKQEHIVCTPDKPRKRHIRVIGKPGMGRPTLMINMIMHDIKNGHGVAAIDLYDDMVEESLDTFPPSSKNNQAAK